MQKDTSPAVPAISSSRSDALRTFQVPQFLTQPDIAPVEVVQETTPVEHAPIKANEILQLIQEQTRQLHEEANRLDVEPTPLYQQTVSEYAARPGPEAPIELKRLDEIGREISSLREQKVAELYEKVSKFHQRVYYSGMSEGQIIQSIRAKLIDDEGLIGGACLGPSPDGVQWKFYHEDTVGKNDWFFVQTHLPTKTLVGLVHYAVEPSYVERLLDNGKPSGVIGSDELAVLLFWAEMTFNKLKQQLYPPTTSEQQLV